jgi:serine/threonine-protein kinase
VQLSGSQALERGLGGKIRLLRPIGSVSSGETTRVEEPTCTAVCSRQRKLGRYDLLFRFAGGGMADLYAAQLVGANGFQRIVAIKVLHDHLAGASKLRQMFIDEARLCSRIAHPNVVQVYELEQADDRHFIVMEYVAGENLRRLLGRTRPSFACCARIIGEAAAALHAAHETHDDQGQPLQLVHCDVSPENIIVSYDGVTKLIDFGVAQVRGGQPFTHVNPLKGKLAYMAPEQAASQPVDRRADIFALGIVLYETSTRSSLFRRKTPGATLRAVVRCEVPPPSERVRGYPEQLERIVLRALQRDPDDRYQTARALQHELEAFVRSAAHPVTASTIQAMMTELFADRIEQRRALLRGLEAPSEGDLPDLGGLTDQWAPPLLWRLRHQWQRVSAIAAGLLVALATLLGLILHWETSAPLAAQARTAPLGAQVELPIRAAKPTAPAATPLVDDTRVAPMPPASIEVTVMGVGHHR